MKTFGIYLQYSRRQMMRGHGIGMTMAYLIKGLLQDPDVKVVIAAPAGSRDNIYNLLSDTLTDSAQIEFLMPDKSLFDYLYNSSVTLNNFFQSLFKSHNRIIENGFNKTKYNLKKSSYFYSPFYISTALLYLIIAKLFVIIYSPFDAAFRAKERMKNEKHPFYTRVLYPIKKMLRPFYHRAKNILFNSIRVVYDVIVDWETKKLVALVNTRTDVKGWYIPTIFWQRARDINAKKIFAIPDIVFFDYPTFYASNYVVWLLNNLTKLITPNTHVICYSNYVKENHIVNKLPISADSVFVLKHGAMDQMVQLTRDRYLPSDAYKINALKILSEYVREHIEWPYLKYFNFMETKFIFYSSQIRYHKNHLNLIKAYELLLRQRYNNIKLIVTGDLIAESPENAEIRDYIITKKLNYDVLSLPNIPSEVLAALNALAICAVNPTLFEGGFPFTFTEAYSVGTPSVMSAIPMVLDEIDDHVLRERMLFDPYNLHDMVDKIEWAIQNHDELYKLQQPLYAKFKARSWEVVAREYLDVYNKVVDNPSPA